MDYACKKGIGFNNILMYVLLLALIISVAPFIVYSEEDTNKNFNVVNYVRDEEENVGKVCIYFFYGIGCPSCARVEPLIERIDSREDVEVHWFEFYNNESNRLLMNQFFDSYSIPQEERGIPVVFISNGYLIGVKNIVEDIEGKIEDVKKTGETKCPVPADNASQAQPLQKLSTLSFVTIAVAALVDSINPCAIAVLLILLSTLLAAGERKRAFKAGFAFITSIYIIYFLFGLGLFTALQVSGLSYYFYKAVGVLAILIGLFNIKDYFWYGKVFLTEIPMSWRPSLNMLLRHVTSPLGAFLMGFVVSLFELPCTGGPYIFILGLLAEKTTQLAAIPILLFYNLIFILPLVLITVFMWKGFLTVEKTEQWRAKNIKVLHLIIGLAMLTLGIIVLFELI